MTVDRDGGDCGTIMLYSSVFEEEVPSPEAVHTCCEDVIAVGHSWGQQEEQSNSPSLTSPSSKFYDNNTWNAGKEMRGKSFRKVPMDIIRYEEHVLLIHMKT